MDWKKLRKDFYKEMCHREDDDKHLSIYENNAEMVFDWFMEKMKVKFDKISAVLTGICIEDKLLSELENFDACDSSGGNFDDAYFMGVEDGKIEVARDITKVIKE